MKIEGLFTKHLPTHYWCGTMSNKLHNPPLKTPCRRPSPLFSCIFLHPAACHGDMRGVAKQLSYTMKVRGDGVLDDIIEEPPYLLAARWCWWAPYFENHYYIEFFVTCSRVKSQLMLLGDSGELEKTYVIEGIFIFELLRHGADQKYTSTGLTLGSVTECKELQT